MKYFAPLAGWKTSYSTNYGHLYGRGTTTGQTNANYALIEANNNAHLTNLFINEKMQEIALRQSIAKEETANTQAGTTTANTTTTTNTTTRTTTNTTDNTTNTTNTVYDNAAEVQNLIGYSDNPVLNGSSENPSRYVYLSGNVTVNDYNSWEDVYFWSNMEDIIIDNKDFVVNADNGSLRMADVRGKLMEFKDIEGDVFMHVCLQKDGGTFDGTTYHEPIIVIGADNENNEIQAGDGGSILWGGEGKGSDELIGGDGMDMFIYNYGNGNDTIYNAETQDIVDISTVNLADIRAIDFRKSDMLFVFQDFSTLNIFGNPETFITSEGTFNADYENKTFNRVEE